MIQNQINKDINNLVKYKTFFFLFNFFQLHKMCFTSETRQCTSDTNANIEYQHTLLSTSKTGTGKCTLNYFLI